MQRFEPEMMPDRQIDVVTRGKSLGWVITRDAQLPRVDRGGWSFQQRPRQRRTDGLKSGGAIRVARSLGEGRK
jgi:hypothetical protein